MTSFIFIEDGYQVRGKEEKREKGTNDVRRMEKKIEQWEEDRNQGRNKGEAEKREEDPQTRRINGSGR